MKNNNVLEFWPFPYAPRENQLTAFEWLSEQSAKYLLIEAPVGAGKSNIGITYSHSLGSTGKQRGNSYILTPQRILQAQYEQSVNGVEGVHLASFYGKSNYECKGKHSTCDIGQMVKPKCIKCPFEQAKNKAKETANTVLNYKLALSAFAYTNSFQARRLMVLDECHTLENQLVDFDALSITEWRCKKYNLKFEKQTSLSKALKWLRDYYVPKLSVVVDKLEQECEYLFEQQGHTLTRHELTKMRELTSLQEHEAEVQMMSLRTNQHVMDHFVLVWDDIKFQFKRLKGEYSFHKHLVPMADRFLFMSSTILNLEGFCEDLGIPTEDAAFLTLSSEFPKENRPVYYMPQCKMNAKWSTPENGNGRKIMLDTVEKLLNEHNDDSGIIHTGNFAIADWLVKKLDGNIPHKIYHHNPDVGDDRNSVIESFQGDPEPSILISPSSTEGLDLKDDLGRFAIFVKVPFGFLGDQWIKRRMDMSHQWYQRRALIDIIQGGGRIVRSPTDFGNVYILDESWAYLYNQAYHMIPRWWRDAYIRF